MGLTHQIFLVSRLGIFVVHFVLFLVSCVDASEHMVRAVMIAIDADQ